MINIKTALMLYMIDAFALNSIKSYKNKDLTSNENEFAHLSNFTYRYTRNRINKMKTTKKQRTKIIDFLSRVVDVEIDFLKSQSEGKTSPQMLMILTLDRLINIVEDKESKLFFKCFNLGSFIDMIFSDENYKDALNHHNDFLDKVLKQKIGAK